MRTRYPLAGNRWLSVTEEMVEMVEMVEMDTNRAEPSVTKTMQRMRSKANRPPFALLKRLVSA